MPCSRVVAIHATRAVIPHRHVADLVATVLLLIAQHASVAAKASAVTENVGSPLHAAAVALVAVAVIATPVQAWDLVIYSVARNREATAVARVSAGDVCEVALGGRLSERCCSYRELTPKASR